MDDALTALTPLHAAESLVLGACAHQPGIFDLCRLCPPQEAGFTLNKPAKFGAAKIGQAEAGVKAQSPLTPVLSDE
jgi:hypothetical protein